MNMLEIHKWIVVLGKTYDVLLDKGFFVASHKLDALYPDCDLLDVELEAGLSLAFWAETKKLETLFVTLKKTTPSTTVYQGELSAPYKKNMDQRDVHALFGKATESRGPIKMPEPMGQTGGWESYPLDQKLYPGVKVVFQYTADMQVDTLVFTLIDKARE
ncbi:pyocin immunity family protein [Pseudomonas fluorescens]|uniref:Pyocin immunity family protein n=1 Tax=Pseudomonas fluorescens TaxID=294 RepID=A0A448DSH8_PSEFL|nr:DUF6392 family protein [Pseudomonas fluorescens]VEF09730.1 pyocin immunity family protein [Pseudomonas fluorescens]